MASISVAIIVAQAPQIRVNAKNFATGPLFVIDEAVERIKDGTITDYRYDPKAAALVRTKAH